MTAAAATRARRLRTHVGELADFLCTAADAPTLFRLLAEIDGRWPDLLFRDFVSAVVVADMLRKPRGRA